MFKDNDIHPSVFARHQLSQSLCVNCFKPRYHQKPLIHLFNQDPLCVSCRSKLIKSNQTHTIEGLKIHSLYQYEDNMERYLYQFKEQYDHTLHSLFIYPYIKQLSKRYRNQLGVYAPSSHEKTKQRSFFALEEIYKDLNIEKQHLFTKEAINQKHQSYHQRQSIIQAIHYCGPPVMNEEDIVLLDDVMTTGATIQAMVQHLKPFNLNVSVLVIAIHPKLLE